MRLWSNPASPFARKVRIVARETGLAGDGILEAAVLIRYENAWRPQALQWNDWIAGQFGKVRSGLGALEAECARWNGRFGIGQITAACVLGYLDFRFPQEAWRGSCPALARWYGGVVERPSVKATVPA